MARIRVLADDTARQIAAGEVIDRPYSIVRELLDNAIDAGAANVRVEVVKGGLEQIRVVDDGAGMDEEDLRLCTLRHATSKIADHRDLARVSTLGFRGEALASIGACSVLTLTSRRKEQASAHRALVRFGRAEGVRPSAGVQGTTAEVSSLFFELPARRRFLKSRGAETALCRRTFLEKALPHPEVAFEFAVDGAQVMRMPAGSPLDRTAAAAGLDAADFACVHGGGEGLRVAALAARPERARRDRSGIHVYLNRRRITDYGLVQAVEYGYGEFLPGGLHPVAYLFVEIDPEMVDFNVHPAKREVRLRRPGELHRAISSTLQREIRSWQSQVERGAAAGESRSAAPSASFLAEAPPVLPALARLPRADAEAAPPDVLSSRPEARTTPGTTPGTWRGRAPDPDAEVRYLGQAFHLFLVAEVGDRIYFVDQHAAHERVLYEQLRGGLIERQKTAGRAIRRAVTRRGRRAARFPGRSRALRVPPAGSGWRALHDHGDTGCRGASAGGTPVSLRAPVRGDLGGLGTGRVQRSGLPACGQGRGGHRRSVRPRAAGALVPDRSSAVSSRSPAVVRDQQAGAGRFGRASVSLRRPAR